MIFNSPVDVAIVLGVALLVFGPKKLPELGKSLGQGLGNFKKALTDAQEDVTNTVKATPHVESVTLEDRGEKVTDVSAVTSPVAGGGDKQGNPFSG
ncbi:MAG: twin-arginine translocase TatA/TatE family subunit [Candidatus Obscuribacter sp.]|nr:twin-arginine translocase TatA/TatE family subunit [Candidatus Melainabacteria bacterium]MBK8221843.1 twin-arginine translocase TatA/TatE family subunit [Candidatus Obscuribacter sp.]MBK9281847.1 twin-arginine translocase TatA/TatE family subunit [Candidatus Obscuribacter sp.]MBL8082430.1 twin-arginine translocase TatA/TatE family subunit [Candidatus Obscuribacter sp.]MDX1986380.1 twin-arginine translocase TatA/TatE family subunit [Candidatus Obscuribacter sp.]